jgi:hypothetical protein
MRPPESEKTPVALSPCVETMIWPAVIAERAPVANNP